MHRLAALFWTLKYIFTTLIVDCFYLPHYIFYQRGKSDANQLDFRCTMVNLETLDAPLALISQKFLAAVRIATPPRPFSLPSFYTNRRTKEKERV